MTQEIPAQINITEELFCVSVYEAHHLHLVRVNKDTVCVNRYFEQQWHAEVCQGGAGIYIYIST